MHKAHYWQSHIITFFSRSLFSFLSTYCNGRRVQRNGVDEYGVTIFDQRSTAKRRRGEKSLWNTSSHLRFSASVCVSLSVLSVSFTSKKEEKKKPLESSRGAEVRSTSFHRLSSRWQGRFFCFRSRQAGGSSEATKKKIIIIKTKLSSPKVSKTLRPHTHTCTHTHRSVQMFHCIC